MILDFHTHLGDIFPHYHDIRLDAPSPMPHYRMISSHSIVDHDRLFYRKRPSLLSLSFLKHAAITIWRTRRTRLGMVIPNLLHDMSRYQITRSVVLPIEYPDHIARSDHVLRACQRIPHLIPFCSVHPRDSGCIEKMHTYINRGAKGLKLHPNFQRIQPTEQTLCDLYTEYEGYHLPVIFHSGLTGRESRFRRGRAYSSLECFGEIPPRFPEMPVVLAHAGITQYRQAIALAQRYENVYLEISGQPARHIREAIAALGVDRIVFGSDWPFWPQSYALQAVRDAVEGDETAERHILAQNALKLLQLEDVA